VSELGGAGPGRDQALARLHDLLLRVARTELGRRAGRHPVTGPKLDDLAQQSADDALLAITAKLRQFRGEIRFTTWAYRFVVLEVSSKLGRHFGSAWPSPSALRTGAGCLTGSGPAPPTWPSGAISSRPCAVRSSRS
jgi:RNA polymerase sigma-70 factor (ECF subfamily)